MGYFIAAHVLSAVGVILSVWGYIKCSPPSPSR